jgi:hypothetical protein
LYDLLFLVSVKERIKPTKPVHISDIMNPRSVTTNIFSPDTKKRVVKSVTAVYSLIPKPANVIGMKPAALATGKKRRKINIWDFKS